MKSLPVIALCLTLVFPLAGCNREQEAPPANKTPVSQHPTATAPLQSAAPKVLLQEPIDLQRGETLADALPIWRRFAAQKPTLLLLSNNPALLPPPAAVEDQLASLLKSAGDKQLRLAGNTQRPDPLYLPAMSVDIALQQGWVDGLAWAFPQRDLEMELKLETIRDQLLTTGMISEPEADTLQYDGKVFAGTLRSLPFRAAALPNLSQLEGPLLLHIDLSYFQKLYKNEVSTPVIPLVASTLQHLAERKLPVLAVTFSYSHDESGIPMNVRFIGDFIAEMTESPQQLQQPLQPVWRQQNNILYLENFFQKDEIRRLTEEQAALAPEAAFAAYNRYQIAAQFKEGQRALDELAKAVAADSHYAKEYLVLSGRAYDARQPDQALRMLKLASDAQPENVWLHLQATQLAVEIGQNSVADERLAYLRQQPWSAVYYPDMPDYLEKLAKPADQ